MTKKMVRVSESTKPKLNKLVAYANKIKDPKYKEVTQESYLDELVDGQYEKLKHLL